MGTKTDLSILYRGHDPTEAKVIWSALNAHDVWAETLDTHFLDRSWWHQFSLNGARVVVMTSDLPNATAVLEALRSPTQDSAPMRRKQWPLPFAICLGALVVGIYLYTGCPIILRRPVLDDEMTSAQSDTS